MDTSKLFLKRPHEAGRIEMSVEDVTNMTVEQLKEKVATMLGLSEREFRELLTRSVVNWLIF